MPTRNGTSSGETIDLRNETSAPPAGYSPDQAWWTVYAQGGNDTVLGSAYNDWIEGGDGNDTLYGYNGKDNLVGGNGIDVLVGGNGDDRLSGGADNDTLYGEAGADWLDGGDGVDRLEGGADNDVLVGGAGGDTLLGGTGDDTFFADAGADIIVGGAGSDRLWGNTGNDQYWYDGQGFDFVNDGVTNTGAARTETTYDNLDYLIISWSDSDFRFDRSGDDLYFYSYADASADGVINNAVFVEDFYLGGHNTVERLVTSSGQGSTYDLTGLLIV